jgi:hypothetical protein
MGGDIIKRATDALGFYSKGAEEARALAARNNQKSTPEAILNALKQKVKKTEVDHSITPNISGVPKMTPADMAEMFQENAPKLTEDVRYAKDHSELPGATAANPQEPPGRTKWGQYTMPGGSDYEERLLRIPTIEKPVDQWVTRYIDPYGDRASRSWYSMPTPEEHQAWAANQEQRGSTAIGEPRQLMRPDADKNFTYPTHWSDTPQVVAYLRAKMRGGGGDGQRDLFKPGPNKVYSVEEGQSDWAQRGRRFGFKGDPNLPTVDEMRQRYHAASEANDAHYDPYAEARRARRNGDISEEQWQAVQAEHQRLEAEYRAAARNYEGSQNRPPPGPSYVMDGDSTTWSNMVNKRALMIAAQKGADGVMIAGPDIHYERWKGNDAESMKNAEGVRTFYRDKFVPSMDKLVKDKSIQDPNAPNRRMDMDPSDIQDLNRDSKFLVHQFDQNGYHARTHGPFDNQAEADAQLDYYRSNYPEHSFDARPYVENPQASQQPKVGPQPTWGLSDTSRDLIQKFGWPYFKQGGAVEQHHDDVDAIIAEAHEIARQNPDLVRKALAIVQAHAEQGDK